MKKIVVIGGGVAGLTAGIYARLAGFPAMIVEKNANPGGECTGWDRQGYHIDNCIHWMMGTTPGTDLYEIWRKTGALSPQVEVLHGETMYTSHLNGQQVTLWRDPERTRREWKALSPADKRPIDILIDNCILAKEVEIPADKPVELKTPGEIFAMGKRFGLAMKLFRTYAGQDVADLGRQFLHPLLACAISDFCTPESLAHSFPLAYGNFISGDGGVPRGGSRAMALRMAKRFTELGGELLTAAPAQQLMLEGDRAAALLLEDGQLLSGDYFVCACDPSVTFGRLLPQRYRDPVLAEVYAKPKAYPAYGMFQAAWAVDEAMDALEGGEQVLPFVPDAPWQGRRATWKTYGYEPDFAPVGKQILQVLLGLSSEGYDHWRAVSADPSAYREEKLALAARLAATAEEAFPAYRGKLTLLDAWTPVTYERWCHAYRGSNQAFTITKASRTNPYPSAWVKGLENVLLSGQWLSPPGGLPGAAIQGKFTIQRLLKKEKREQNL